MEECFIAIHEEYAGVGSTIETAVNDLKENTTSVVEHGDVTFYKATQIEVELKYVEVSDNES